MLKKSKTDITRMEHIRRYFSGESFGFKQDPKENYEISSDGVHLYFYSHKILKNTGKVIDGKRIYLLNCDKFSYVDEYDKIPSLRYQILEKCLHQILDIELHDISTLIIGISTTYNLNACIRLFTSNIFQAIKYPKHWGEHGLKYHFKKWNYNILEAVTQARSFIEQAGQNPLDGIRIPQKNIKEIQKDMKGRWKQMAFMMALWICNGYQFSDEDDEFVKEYGQKHLKYMYMALGGKYKVGEDLVHTTLWILSPNTPVDEIPLFLGHDNSAITFATRIRLERGK